MLSQRSNFLGRYDAENQTVVAVDNHPVSAELNRGRPLCPTSADLSAVSGDWATAVGGVSFVPAVAYPLSQPYATWATLLTGLLLTGSLVLFLRNLQNELVRTQQLNDLKLRFFFDGLPRTAYPPQHDFVIDGIATGQLFPALSDQQKQNNLERIHLTAQQMSQHITDFAYPDSGRGREAGVQSRTLGSHDLLPASHR